jgi:20S proteasome subunit alpha 5
MSFQSMTLEDACKQSLTILKQVMEEKLSATNVEMATITPEQKYHLFGREELEELIKKL